MAAVTVTQQVVAELRRRILEGEYPTGTHLHEVALAKDLAVSRTPIREALRVLENDKIILYSANRGYIVRNIELSDVLDSYDVRGCLEGLACRLIAEHGLSAAGKEGFADILRRGALIFEQESWGEAEQADWQAINEDFHQLLLNETGNRLLAPIIQQVRAFPDIFNNRTISSQLMEEKNYTRSQLWRAHTDHVHIVQAMSRGEGARAEMLMREHVYLNREFRNHSLTDI